MTRLVLLASLTVASVLGQESYGQPTSPTGDTGQYVHDTRGDHGPYYYWKLRQQGKSSVAPTAPAAPAYHAAPAPQRQIVTVRKPAAHQRYIQPAPAPVHHAPARHQYIQPAPSPAPVQQAPVPTQNNYHPQANPFQVDINTRSYAYTAPTYSAQARGVSFTYNAQY